MAITKLTRIASSPLLSWLPVISGDGRYLATDAYNPTFFIDPAFVGTYGVVLVDLATGSAKYMLPQTGQAKLGSGTVSGINGDGSAITFSSNSSFTPNWQGGAYFELTKTGSITTLGAYPDGTDQFRAGMPALSADGNHLALSGTRLDRAGIAVSEGLFEVDLRSGAVIEIGTTPLPNSSWSDGANPRPSQLSISADGRYVAYDTSNTVDKNHHLFVYDCVTGLATAVDTSTDGSLGNRGETDNFTISGNGRYVVFTSNSTNLVASDAPRRTVGVFVKDLLTGAIVEASTDAYGRSGLDGETYLSTQAISDDGRYVVFESHDNFGFKELESLFPNPDFRSLTLHTFVKDMVTGALALLNSTPETIGLSAHGVAISGDGKTILFQGFQMVNEPTLHAEFQTYVMPLPKFEPVTVNDVLKGSAGADTMAGGLGDDDYYVNDTRDIVVEYPNQGRDTIHTTVSYTLPANVEVLILEGTQAINGTGNELDNVLIGNAVANVLVGGAGDDVFYGNGGSDNLDGGPGHDTAVFKGNVGDYTIKGGAVATVRAPDGSLTTMSSIETLRFDNATVTFETDGVVGQAYRLYQAAFDRKPDLGGLGYWIAQMQDGMDLKNVAAQFVQSVEFKAMFGAASANSAFVGLLYQHILHREADSGGAAFWSGLLDGHRLSQAEVLVQFSESPENIAALVGVLTDGVAYQPYH